MDTTLKKYTINSQLRSKLYWVDFGIVILLAVATFVINLRMIRDGLKGLGDLLWHITWGVGISLISLVSLVLVWIKNPRNLVLDTP